MAVQPFSKNYLGNTYKGIGSVNNMANNEALMNDRAYGFNRSPNQQPTDLSSLIQDVGKIKPVAGFEPIKPIELGPMPELPPPPQSFLPELRQLGQQRLEAGTAALRDLFPEQREAATERISSRGLTGSGVAEELQGRQAKTEQQQLNQLIAEVEAQNLAAEISEMQRTGQITAEQGMMRYELEAQRAMAQGDMDRSIAIANSQNRLAADELRTKTEAMIKELQMKGIEIQNNKEYNDIMLANQGQELEQQAIQAAATAANAYAPQGGDDYMQVYYEILADMGFEGQGFVEYQKRQEREQQEKERLYAPLRTYNQPSSAPIGYQDMSIENNPIARAMGYRWDEKTRRWVK